MTLFVPTLMSISHPKILMSFTNTLLLTICNSNTAIHQDEPVQHLILITCCGLDLLYCYQHCLSMTVLFRDAMGCYGTLTRQKSPGQLTACMFCWLHPLPLLGSPYNLPVFTSSNPELDYSWQLQLNCSQPNTYLHLKHSSNLFQSSYLTVFLLMNTIHNCLLLTILMKL